MDLNNLVFSNALRDLLRELDEPLSPVFFSSPPRVTPLPGSNAWKVNGDFRELIIRTELDAGGAALLGIYEHVQSRGPILDFVIELRSTLIRLQATSPDAPHLPREPFGEEIDGILEAVQAIISGDDFDSGGLFDDLKELAETIVDAMRALFSEVANGAMPSDAALLAPLAAAATARGRGRLLTRVVLCSFPHRAVGSYAREVPC